MADFGLAAQIGRGGAGGGMPQQVDPMNRMTQMLQLQQLQQNMMLAQELAARQREMQPLLLQEKREGIQTEQARRGLIGEQTGRAREERQQAERAGLAERGALEYISSTPPELRADPARLDVLRKTNPGAYSYMTDTIAKARALQEKARAEGFSADEAQFKFRQAALGGMSSLLPAVTEQTWPTVYNEFKSLDPIGSRVIGPDFTPENVAGLRARVQSLSDLSYEKDERGYEYILNKRTGEKTPVVKRSANPPAQSTFGALDQNAQTASPQLIGQGVAGLASPNAMQPPGAAPIIQPRAAAPEVGGFGPVAIAEGEKTLAREQAQADIKRAEEERTKGKVKGEFQATLDDITNAYRELGRQGALITPQTPVGQRLKTFAASQAPGITGVVSPEMGAPIQTIENLRQSLVSALMGATGMSAKQIDSNAEMKAYLNSLTSPGQTADTVVKTFNNMSRRFGLGKTLTVEDLTGAKTETAPVGRRRGASSPPAAPPSIDELLKKYQ